MFTIAFNIQPVGSNETIYIMPDGSVYPPTANSKRWKCFLHFADDIYGSIVVERDNIVVDGAVYSLQGNRSKKRAL